MSVVRFERAGDIGHIVQSDPPENELGRQWADDLAVAVHQASGSNIRVLIVRSEGPNFGTGGAVAEWPGKDIHWFHTFISEVNQAYKAIEALRVPTIAAVRGKAVGGHYELVLHCDLIVAAADATFLAVEAHTGMVPLAGGLQRLADRIGRNRAAQLVLLTEPLSGKAAGEIGLACRVVPDGEVEGVAAGLAERLAAGPTLAYGATRALLKAWQAGGVAGADDLLLDIAMRLFQTDDAQKAFLALKEAIQAGGDKAESEALAKISFAGR